MLITDRRYDIDWIRVIAIWLLLIYHTAIGFQPWGMMIGFITNSEPWAALWTPMAMLNVWRIPLLFFVSGMGVYFAIQNRNWKQLWAERASRILVPFVFGTLCIVPIHIYIMSSYYGMEYKYFPHTGHLWFLGNIVVYILLFTPLFYFLKKNETGKLAVALKKIMSHPVGLLIVIAAFVTEVLIIKPQPYEFYVMNLHGFFHGLLSFFFGFYFVYSGEVFWKMIVKWRWLFLLAGLSLFVLRMVEFEMSLPIPIYQLPIETICWILAVFAFGNKYLNQKSKTLQYLSQAAYPVYVLHMVFLYLGSVIIFPLDIVAPLKFLLVLVFTFAGCYFTYEIIRRIKALRFLFGLHNSPRSVSSSPRSVSSQTEI
ncbi:acyltransferase [Chryseotalea sanaruensis]|uniref:Acyltransferase n=1 Tax=Chryseotalea sanaruensis TaxID=2482724 RepID=A0A401UD99_9BACT|nr:acyltransferase family protein [Chryseotalea sanaruensis]GCC52822.1 acyltransferase [Chryseotalea sanaruensis]